MGVDILEGIASYTPIVLGFRLGCLRAHRAASIDVFFADLRSKVFRVRNGKTHMQDEMEAGCYRDMNQSPPLSFLSHFSTKQCTHPSRFLIQSRYEHCPYPLPDQLQYPDKKPQSYPPTKPKHIPSNRFRRTSRAVCCVMLQSRLSCPFREHQLQSRDLHVVSLMVLPYYTLAPASTSSCAISR